MWCAWLLQYLQTPTFRRGEEKTPSTAIEACLYHTPGEQDPGLPNSRGRGKMLAEIPVDAHHHHDARLDSLEDDEEAAFEPIDSQYPESKLVSFKPL